MIGLHQSHCIGIGRIAGIVFVEILPQQQQCSSLMDAGMVVNDALTDAGEIPAPCRAAIQMEQPSAAELDAHAARHRAVLTAHDHPADAFMDMAVFLIVNADCRDLRLSCPHQLLPACLLCLGKMHRFRNRFHIKIPVDPLFHRSDLLSAMECFTRIEIQDAFHKEILHRNTGCFS